MIFHVERRESRVKRGHDITQPPATKLLPPDWLNNIYNRTYLSESTAYDEIVTNVRSTYIENVMRN